LCNFRFQQPKNGWPEITAGDDQADPSSERAPCHYFTLTQWYKTENC
jgi:hypothetical protein